MLTRINRHYVSNVIKLTAQKYEDHKWIDIEEIKPVRVVEPRLFGASTNSHKIKKAEESLKKLIEEWAIENKIKLTEISKKKNHVKDKNKIEKKKEKLVDEYKEIKEIQNIPINSYNLHYLKKLIKKYQTDTGNNAESP